MSKAAIYCRLSEEDRNKASAEDDSASIQNQKSMLLQYAIQQGWESIPTLTASGGISSYTASICLAIISGLTSKISMTRAVFSATTETIALIPYTPCALKAFKSA